MPTITWSDRKQVMEGPERIVSPTHPGPCCATQMETTGHPHYEARCSWQVRRCRVCGFTVRKIVQEFPDQVDCLDLRKRLVTYFSRLDLVE